MVVIRFTLLRYRDCDVVGETAILNIFTIAGFVLKGFSLPFVYAVFIESESQSDTFSC